MERRLSHVESNQVNANNMIKWIYLNLNKKSPLIKLWEINENDVANLLYHHINWLQ
jgi:hypothetical protein